MEYCQYFLLVPLGLFHVPFHYPENVGMCTLISQSLQVILFQDLHVYKQYYQYFMNPLSFHWGVHGGCHAPHY